MFLSIFLNVRVCSFMPKTDGPIKHATYASPGPIFLKTFQEHLEGPRFASANLGISRQTVWRESFRQHKTVFIPLRNASKGSPPPWTGAARFVRIVYLLRALTIGPQTLNRQVDNQRNCKGTVTPSIATVPFAALVVGAHGVGCTRRGSYSAKGRVPAF